MTATVDSLHSQTLSDEEIMVGLPGVFDMEHFMSFEGVGISTISVH